MSVSHALLSDEMGTLVCEEEKLLYSFFNADQIIDFLLSIVSETLLSNYLSCLQRLAGETPPFSAITEM